MTVRAEILMRSRAVVPRFGRIFRIRDVGAYLRVRQQRADQMFHEGKLPEPELADSIEPMWESGTIERWAEPEW
jgi:hypothetical protein